VAWAADRVIQYATQIEPELNNVIKYEKILLISFQITRKWVTCEQMLKQTQANSNVLL
jgi:hypothetical protein